MSSGRRKRQKRAIRAVARAEAAKQTQAHEIARTVAGRAKYRKRLKLQVLDAPRDPKAQSGWSGKFGSDPTSPRPFFLGDGRWVPSESAEFRDSQP